MRPPKADNDVMSSFTSSFIVFGGPSLSEHLARYMLGLCQSTDSFVKTMPFFRRRHGGCGKKRGRKTSRRTPSYGTFSIPPGCRCSAFSCTKIHDQADQKLFWKGPKIFGRVRAAVRFPPPPHVLRPHIMAQFLNAKSVNGKLLIGRVLACFDCGTAKPVVVL